MSYTGTIVEDLQKIVEGFLQRNARVCVTCKQPYGYHSAIGSKCPDLKSIGQGYLQSIFAERLSLPRIPS